MDLEFAKSLHFRELDRRTLLDGAPTLRVAVLALLGGAFSFYGKEYEPTFAFLGALFIVCVALAIFFAALSVAWLIKSNVGFTWLYLPSAVKLKTYYDQLKAYDVEYGIDSGTPESLFNERLLFLLVEAASKNNINNNVRSNLVARATHCLVLATIFMLLAGVPILCQALERVLLMLF